MIKGKQEEKGEVHDCVHNYLKSEEPPIIPCTITDYYFPMIYTSGQLYITGRSHVYPIGHFSSSQKKKGESQKDKPWWLFGNLDIINVIVYYQWQQLLVVSIHSQTVSSITPRGGIVGSVVLLPEITTRACFFLLNKVDIRRTCGFYRSIYHNILER